MTSTLQRYLWYKQSNPASSAQRALMPSQIPGAICARCEMRCGEGLEIQMNTYDDTRSCKHLSETGSGVPRQRPLKVVLWVESRIGVHVQIAMNNTIQRARGLRDWRDYLYPGACASIGRSLDRLRLPEVVETGHCLIMQMGGE